MLMSEEDLTKHGFPRLVNESLPDQSYFTLTLDAADTTQQHVYAIDCEMVCVVDCE